MATITLTIPDAQLPRVIAALCAYDPISATPPTGPNAKAAVVRWVKMTVAAYEERLAREALVEPDVSTLVT